MTSKFMANAAFEARLLLRPSHQRTVWTVNKLRCPIPGRPTLPPILSSRSYSDSTSTPPFPKSSGSTSTPPPFPKPSGSTSTPPPFPKPSGSTSTPPPFPKPSGSTSTPPLFPKPSGSTSTPPLFPKPSGSTSTPPPPFPKSSGSTEGSQSSGPKDKNWNDPKVWVGFLGGSWVGSLGTVLLGGWITYYTDIWQHVRNSTWEEEHQESRRREHESTRESAIYDKLKKGPEFKESIIHPIPRTPIVEEIRELITPEESSRSYPVVIGEHGTGKTSLIALAVKSVNEPKGIVYLDVPDMSSKYDSVMKVAKAMREALGWSPDQVLDSKELASLEEGLQVFSHLATKYKQEYGKIPVLIIDNANKLAEGHQEVLNQFQDYAKRAADQGIVTVVFVSSEGRVPRRMKERASWSRSGLIHEITDVSKEEALQYLNHRGIDKEQAAQIHELIGGRMIHLKTTADEITRGATLEAVRKKLFIDAKGQLNSAEVLPDLRYHKEGAEIIRELFKKGSISENAYYSLVGRVIGRKLLETNVFAFHYNSQEITFQSTVMKRYCEENGADLGLEDKD